MPKWKDTGALATPSGGTGFTSFASGDLLIGTGGVGPNGLAVVGLGATAGGLLYVGTGTPAWSSLIKIDPATGKLYERGRSTPMGEPIPFTPSLSADTGASWTVGGGSLAFAYGLINKYAVLRIDCENSTLSTSPAPSVLTFSLPFSITGNYDAELIPYFAGGNWNGDGLLQILGGSSTVQITRLTGAPFIGGAGFYVRKTLIFETPT